MNVTEADLFRAGVLKSNPARWPSFYEWLQSPNLFPVGWKTDLPYIKAIADKLDELRLGDVHNLYVSAPPRHGKSETITIRFAVYILEQDPTALILVMCHTKELAVEFSQRIADLYFEIRGSKYRRGRKSTQDYWLNECGGGVYACGINAPPTGRGFKWFLTDDLIKKAEDAESQRFRDKMALQWQMNVTSRKSAEYCRVVMTATRWNEDDLPGRLLRNEAGEWSTLILPAEAEENDPLGRKLGEPLGVLIGWTKEKLARLRESYRKQGLERYYEALYQCRPTNQQGGLFLKSDFEHIVSETEVPPLVHVIRAWDLATQVKQASDFTAGALIGIDYFDNLWVLDMRHEKLEWPDVQKLIEDTAASDAKKYPHRVQAAIEAQGTQLGMIQSILRKPISYEVAFHGVKWTAGMDKKQAASGWAARARLGKLRLVRGAWNDKFIEECTRFTGLAGERDDMVDAVSLGFIRLQKLVPREPDAPPPFGSEAHLNMLIGLQREP